MIEVDGLTKAFGSLRVLKGLTFRVESGEALFVLGPSGAGKSTLLRCLNGLVMPGGGAVAIDGIPIERRRLREVRRKVGFIFQGFNLVGNLSVLRNVLIGRLAEKAPWDLAFSKADRRIALDAIAAVGLADKADARADTLSGGQKQRVGIARALAHDPAVLLADEPVSNLDPRSGPRDPGALAGDQPRSRHDAGLQHPRRRPRDPPRRPHPRPPGRDDPLRRPPRSVDAGRPGPDLRRPPPRPRPEPPPEVAP